MDFRRENNEIHRGKLQGHPGFLDPNWKNLWREPFGAVGSVPTGRYLQFHLEQKKQKHLGAKPWKLGVLFSTPIIWRSNRVSNRVSLTAPRFVAPPISECVAPPRGGKKMICGSQKKWIKNTQLFEVEMFNEHNEHNEHNEPFIHYLYIFLQFIRNHVIYLENILDFCGVCSCNRYWRLRIAEEACEWEALIYNIVTGLSYVCCIINPFPLLLNVHQILKTRVHLPVRKISGWPIWLLIDPL